MSKEKDKAAAAPVEKAVVEKAPVVEKPKVKARGFLIKRGKPADQDKK
jgi:hypothetical protein